MCLIRGVLIPRVPVLMDDGGILCLHVRSRRGDDIDVARPRMTTCDAFVEGWARATRHSCDAQLLNLLRINAKKYLYRTYVKRVVSVSWLCLDLKRDGATSFEIM